MKSVAVLSALVSAAVAQSSTSSAAGASSSSNPLIPTGISDGCSSFLNTLNSNSGFSACTSPIISATQQFGPGGNETSGATTGSINSALNNLCSTSAFSACPDSTIGDQLTSFYSACSAELTSNPNTDVIRTYDVLYMLSPMRQAICSKDDNGKYCVTEIPSASNSDAAGNVDIETTKDTSQKNLWIWTGEDPEADASSTVTRRDVSNTTAALIPNTTTFSATNLVFLFLEPTMSSTQLCTACTRNILTPYINFESKIPYGPGLGKSPCMSGQSALYNGVQGTCGANFLSGAVQAAGGISSGILNGAALRSMSQDVNAVVAAMLGAAALAAAAF
ncbi:hypothetical protein BJ138DRAFT_1113340 [Hygrophoropsis aurantiaca]|uniref:Uncharacterized protein n=1 Tax=Hygrophoropsis aurantiaca TaxID=72124 RepID=A0ACB8ADK5_9AGAM|nr:hypothetical protein BJ138DRAFT_1113340 [Hygrophoropsis aurantiaca]